MSLPTTALDLRREHDHIEQLSRLLLDSYRSDSWTDVESHWNELEPALRAHMTREEERAFPSFRKMNPVETAALLEEHTALRAQLSVFGVNLELHAVPRGDVEALVEKNRAHSLREEVLLFAWLTQTGHGVSDPLEEESARPTPTSSDALVAGASRHIFTG